MSDSQSKNGVKPIISRRDALHIGAGTAGATLLTAFGGVRWAYAADKPPLGTWPEGSKGDTVYLGAAVPLTGAYAVQGADELKGWEMAIEHMNTNHPLMKKLAPKVNNGVLGKKVALVSADSAAKPSAPSAANVHQQKQNRADDGLNVFGSCCGAEQVC